LITFTQPDNPGQDFIEMGLDPAAYEALERDFGEVSINFQNSNL